MMWRTKPLSELTSVRVRPANAHSLELCTSVVVQVIFASFGKAMKGAFIGTQFVLIVYEKFGASCAAKGMRMVRGRDGSTH